MSEEGTDVHVRVSKYAVELVNELKVIEVRGEKIKICDSSDVVREAFYKGLSLMTMERIEYRKLVEEKAKEGAKKLYASLNTKPAEKGQTVAGNEEEESVKKE